jgi:hypothetical protein
MLKDDGNKQKKKTQLIPSLGIHSEPRILWIYNSFIPRNTFNGKEFALRLIHPEVKLKFASDLTHLKSNLANLHIELPRQTFLGHFCVNFFSFLHWGPRNHFFFNYETTVFLGYSRFYFPKLKLQLVESLASPNFHLTAFASDCASGHGGIVIAIFMFCLSVCLFPRNNRVPGVMEDPRNFIVAHLRPSHCPNKCCAQITPAPRLMLAGSLPRQMNAALISLPAPKVTALPKSRSLYREINAPHLRSLLVLHIATAKLLLLLLLCYCCATAVLLLLLLCYCATAVLLLCYCVICRQKRIRADPRELNSRSSKALFG